VWIADRQDPKIGLREDRIEDRPSDEPDTCPGLTFAQRLTPLGQVLISATRLRTARGCWDPDYRVIGAALATCRRVISRIHPVAARAAPASAEQAVAVFMQFANGVVDNRMVHVGARSPNAVAALNDS
jgi:hypothetical protein